MSKLGLVVFAFIVFFILRGMLQGRPTARRPEPPRGPEPPRRPAPPPDDVIDVEVIEKE